ncbi:MULTISPECIES: hypothetical protein [Citrobacter freundii complex]|uniref:hypothetical protein n=1 Tax=Citrobacter freundii complex TaxID=1344959 RepID=UPI000CDBE698|nr:MULTISPECIES: hypothetical protein [Citrobacter freundii complex]AUZ70354.1 hypothetical protein C2U41_13865 [Citrobacter freundii complex sp. CFNIH4]ELP1415159.1 hypothetical protein [Citrobacter freundii]MBA7947741.1 hypothetical protein [Citrobacter freundii]POU13172.1 hypothetical protein C3368_09385 [Citrobacter freundii complex sp. CFNIH7]POU16772.1 hypothetical protein C3381_08235 [Citrobacter freundii complex sp. CFNIH6]
MPKAVPKSLEISIQLIDYLRLRKKLDDFNFRRYIRQIEGLNDRFSQDYLLALAYAANGRKDEAVSFFEESLKVGVDTYALNYAVYLEEYGLHRELYEVVNRLISRYGCKSMLRFGWETNLFTGKIDAALFYAERFITAAKGKEAEEMADDASGIIRDTKRFKECTGLTDDEYIDMAQRIVDVADSYGVRPAAIEFIFVPEEKSASYIMRVKTEDVDILSDMNIDIAFSLAENDSLAGKKLGVWYRGYSEEASNACN